MILPIILSFSSFSNANIREISEIAKIFPVFNIVPQIALMNTVFLGLRY